MMLMASFLGVFFFFFSFYRFVSRSVWMYFEFSTSKRPFGDINVLQKWLILEKPYSPFEVDPGLTRLLKMPHCWLKLDSLVGRTR